MGKLGARFGLTMGPWGGIAGGLLGAVAGASLSKKYLEATQATLPAGSDAT